jgi:hypothetical protein
MKNFIVGRQDYAQVTNGYQSYIPEMYAGAVKVPSGTGFLSPYPVMSPIFGAAPTPVYNVELPPYKEPIYDQPVIRQQPIFGAAPTEEIIFEPQQPILTVEPMNPISTINQLFIDDNQPSEPVFSNDTQPKSDVLPSSTEPTFKDDVTAATAAAPVPAEAPVLPTKPVSRNLTPFVYAGLGILAILIVARMVTKK